MKSKQVSPFPQPVQGVDAANLNQPSTKRKPVKVRPNKRKGVQVSYGAVGHDGLKGVV